MHHLLFIIPLSFCILLESFSTPCFFYFLSFVHLTRELCIIFFSLFPYISLCILLESFTIPSFLYSLIFMYFIGMLGNIFFSLFPYLWVFYWRDLQHLLSSFSSYFNDEYWNTFFLCAPHLYKFEGRLQQLLFFIHLIFL